MPPRLQSQPNFEDGSVYRARWWAGWGSKPGHPDEKSGALAKLSYRPMTRGGDWRRRSKRCLSEEVESDDGYHLVPGDEVVEVVMYSLDDLVPVD